MKPKSEAVTTFLTGMLESVDPSQARGRDVSVRDALDAAAAKIDGGSLAKQPAVEAAVRKVIGSTYGSLGLYDAAERQLRTAIELETRSGRPRCRAPIHLPGWCRFCIRRASAPTRSYRRARR